MEEEKLEFYGVHPCTYSWSSKNDTQNAEILGYQIRRYWAYIISKNGEKYTVEGNAGEKFTATIEECFEKYLPNFCNWVTCWEHEKFIITKNNSEFTFDMEVNNQWPHFLDQDDWDYEWRPGYFFKSIEDAIDKMDMLIEIKDY